MTQNFELNLDRSLSQTMHDGGDACFIIGSQQRVPIGDDQFLPDVFPEFRKVLEVHVNDAIQTFIRPTAGAIVFAASASNLTKVNPILALVAGLLVSGGVHAVKSLAVRPLVTATTGGAANVPVSIAEDATSTVVSLLSVVLPVVAVCLIILVTTIIVTRLIFKPKKEPPVNPN